MPLRLDDQSHGNKNALPDHLQTYKSGVIARGEQVFVCWDQLLPRDRYRPKLPLAERSTAAHPAISWEEEFHPSPDRETYLWRRARGVDGRFRQCCWGPACWWLP